MKLIVFSMILAVLMITPGLAGELGVEDFEVKTTKNLIDLCTAPPEEPLFSQAVHFCHGYLIGAYHYYEASVSGPNAHRIVCPPEDRPSRDETIQEFLQWAKDHPEHWNELPVETEFRFLTEIWPCNP
jgi:hypothetical protein